MKESSLRPHSDSLYRPLGYKGRQVHITREEDWDRLRALSYNTRPLCFNRIADGT